MKFVELYQDFLKKCKGKIPEVQILHELEMVPRINAPITPPPRDWFVASFDWYVGLKLVCGAIYGPFYRVDGSSFWPQIGKSYDEYSEKKCFFGLERPKDVADATRLYNMKRDTDTKYIYEIFIEMPKWPLIEAWIFLGPVKDGNGFQVNPNSVVVELIKGKIVKGEIKRYSQTDNGIYNYQNSELYYYQIET